MPLAKLHVLEGQYDETRLGKVSSAVQNGLISALGIPPEDFFQIIYHPSVLMKAPMPILFHSKFRDVDWRRSAECPGCVLSFN